MAGCFVEILFMDHRAPRADQGLERGQEGPGDHADGNAHMLGRFAPNAAE